MPPGFDAFMAAAEALDPRDGEGLEAIAAAHGVEILAPAVLGG